MSVNTLRDKITQKVGELQTIRAAFDWETSNPEGQYPFATVTLRAGEASFLSTSHNQRVRRFRIRVYQERSKVGQGPETAEDIMANIIDELEVAFDTNTTLSGTCKYVLPVNWSAGYVDREHDTRILEIDVDATEVTQSDYRRPM